MWNRLIIGILTLFIFCNCTELIACAHAETLIFGPEFFTREGEKTQRVLKSFSVKNPDQQFILSVQNGEREEGSIGKAIIVINGVTVASPDEFNRNFKILTKPVKLQQHNEVAVEVVSRPDTSILVTIMSTEDRTVTANIPPLGGTIDLDGYSIVIFPPGSFSRSQDVTVSVTSSSSQNIFEATATGPHLPYEIRINSGKKAPEKDIAVMVNVPDSFIASNYAMHVFARVYSNPEVPENRDSFYLFSSAIDETVKTVHTILPKYVFSNQYGKNGTYEAIITIGLIH